MCHFVSQAWTAWIRTRQLPTGRLHRRGLGAVYCHIVSTFISSFDYIATDSVRQRTPLGTVWRGPQETMPPIHVDDPRGEAGVTLGSKILSPMRPPCPAGSSFLAHGEMLWHSGHFREPFAEHYPCGTPEL